MDNRSNEQLIVKSYDFVEARYNLSAPEIKIISLLASVIKREDDDLKSHTFKASDLLEITNLGAQNYSKLRETTKDLMKKVLEIKTNDTITQVAFLSGVQYHTNKGLVTLRFDPFLKPHLLHFKDKYIKYNFPCILDLKSSYSIRLYEFLIKWVKVGSFKLSLVQMRYFLGFEDEKYKQYTDFKKRVLLKAQSELKEKADLYFEFNEIKVGRKVDQIEFIIKKNKKNARKDILIKEVNPDEEKNKPSLKSSSNITDKELTVEEYIVFKQLKTIGLSEEQTIDLIRNHSLDLIKNQISYLEFSNPEYPSGFIIKAIKNNWSPPKKYYKYLKDQEYKKKLDSLREVAEYSDYITLSNGSIRRIIEVNEKGNFKLLNEETGEQSYLMAKDAIPLILEKNDSEKHI